MADTWVYVQPRQSEEGTPSALAPLALPPLGRIEVEQRTLEQYDYGALAASETIVVGDEGATEDVVVKNETTRR